MVVYQQLDNQTIRQELTNQIRVFAIDHCECELDSDKT